MGVLRFRLRVHHNILFLTLLIQILGISKAIEPTGLFQDPELNKKSMDDMNFSLENVPQIENSINSLKNNEVFGDKLNFWQDAPFQDQTAKSSIDNLDNEKAVEIVNPENQTPATDRTFGLFKAIGKVIEKRPVIPIFTSKTKIYPPKPSYHGQGSHHEHHHKGWGRKPPRRKPKWGRRPRRFRKRRPGKPKHVYDGVKVHYKGPNYDGDGYPISHHHFSSPPKFTGLKHYKRKRPRHKRRHRPYRHRRPHHHSHHDGPEHHDFDNGFEDSNHIGDHFHGPPHTGRPIAPFKPDFNSHDDGIEHSNPSDNGKPSGGFRTPFWVRPKSPQHTDTDHNDSPNFDIGPTQQSSPANYDDKPSPSFGPPPRTPFRHPKQSFDPPEHDSPNFDHGPEDKPEDHFSNSFNDVGPSPRKPFRRPRPSFGPPPFPEHDSGFDLGPQENNNDHDHFSNNFDHHDSPPYRGPRKPFRRPKPSFGPPQEEDHEFDSNHEHSPNNSPPSFGPPRKPFRRPRPSFFGRPQHDNSEFDHGPENHPSDSFPNSINDQLSNPPRRPRFRPRRPNYPPPSPEYDYHDQPPQHTESAEHSSGHFEKPPHNIQPPRRPYSYKKPIMHEAHGHGGNEFNTPQHHDEEYYNEIERPNAQVHPPTGPYYRRPKPHYPPPHHNDHYPDHHEFQDNPNHGGHHYNRPPRPYNFRQRPRHRPPPPPHSYLPPSQGPPQHSQTYAPPPREPIIIRRPTPVVKEPEVIYGSPMPLRHPNTAYGPSPQLRRPIPFKPLPSHESQNSGNNNLHHNNFIDQSNKPLGSGTQDEPQRPGMSQQLFNQVKNLVMKLTNQRNNTSQNPEQTQNQHQQPKPLAYGNSMQSTQHNNNNQAKRNPFSYSTLPKSMAQYKPDPTHQTLPKLTYDSIRSESNQIYNRPGKAMRDTTPARIVTKFTPSDAIIIPKLQRRMTSAEEPEVDVKSDEKGLNLKLKPQRGFQNMIKAHAKLM